MDSNLNEVLDESNRGIPITNASTDDSLKSRLKTKTSKALSSKKVRFITNAEDGGGKELELFDSRDNRISEDRTMTDTGMSFGQYNNQTSNNPNSVKGHENVLSGKTPLQCDFCFKMFIKKFKLNEHRRTHTGEKPYVCNVCGRSFSQKVNLVRHNRTHNVERPYACNYCGQLFSQKENLSAHIKTHTGETPYACNICGQSFSRQHHLDRHNNRTHVVKKPETCNVCGQSFSKKGDLVIHYRTHVGEKPFECGQCDKKFSTNGNLKRHIQCIHTK
ncbi:hypothetical protein ACI65C_002610 [Semiaphis heraclei]